MSPQDCAKRDKRRDEKRPEHSARGLSSRGEGGGADGREQWRGEALGTCWGDEGSANSEGEVSGVNPRTGRDPVHQRWAGNTTPPAF